MLCGKEKTALVYDGQELLVEFRWKIYIYFFYQNVKQLIYYEFLVNLNIFLSSCIFKKKFILFYRTGPEVSPFDYNGFVATLSFIEMTTEAPTTIAVDTTNKSRK